MTRLSNSSRHSHPNAGAGGHLQARGRVLFHRQAASHDIEVEAQLLTFLGNAARRPSGKIRDGHQGTIAQNHHAGGNVPDIRERLAQVRPGAGRLERDAGCTGDVAAPKDSRSEGRNPMKSSCFWSGGFTGLGVMIVRPSGRDYPEECSSNQESALRWTGIPELPLLPRNMLPPANR